jgi:hypothetical protein
VGEAGWGAVRGPVRHQVGITYRRFPSFFTWYNQLYKKESRILNVKSMARSLDGYLLLPLKLAQVGTKKGHFSQYKNPELYSFLAILLMSPMAEARGRGGR